MNNQYLARRGGLSAFYYYMNSMNDAKLRRKGGVKLGKKKKNKSKEDLNALKREKGEKNGTGKQDPSR